jgi:hypothetical protein
MKSDPQEENFYLVLYIIPFSRAVIYSHMLIDFMDVEVLLEKYFH